MENRSHALMTGFFTIALIVAAIVAGIWFNRDRVERVPYLLATTMSVPGLNPQAAVRYRGLEVGKVDEISFDPKVAGQILVRISIDAETPVTRTTYATLGYQGVTGIAYIQLDDDKTGSPLIASDDDHVARIPLQPGFLDQLEKRGKVILATAEEMTSRINELMSPTNRKTILAAFDDVSKTADEYRAIPPKLEATLARLPELTAKTEQGIRSVTAFADSADQLARNWDKLGSDLQGPDGALTKLTGTVERVGSSLEGTISDVEMETLPSVVAMTDEARTSLRAVKRTMNTINDRPQSLIFGTAGTPPGPGEPGFSAPGK